MEKELIFVKMADIPVSLVRFKTVSDCLNSLWNK